MGPSALRYRSLGRIRLSVGPSCGGSELQRRGDLVAWTQTINRLHRLPTDLVPAGARRNLSAKRAAALLSEVTPTGAPAVIRWQLAVDLVADVRQLEQRIAAVEAHIRAVVAQSNTSLVQLFGSGPVLAATFPSVLTQ